MPMLISGGRGELVMQKRLPGTAAGGAEEEEEGGAAAAAAGGHGGALEKYSGVKVRGQKGDALCF